MSEAQDPRQDLQDAIAALQAQRAVLGDAVVDAALGPLRNKLATLTTAERRLRQVSVLFLDIVGSTHLSQHLDPEEIQQVLDSALADFSHRVQEHGGEVLQYAGDNLLATFGADVTREDDAERAVRCGLALLQEAARHGQRVREHFGHTGFDARVGIHTGTVLRGGGVDEGNSLRGIAVNIAARMEQTAAPGRLRVSHDTWLLVRGLFDAEPQEPILVKGHDAPITSWLVSGTKPRPFRLPTRGIEGQETPLVGRAAELAALTAGLEQVLADRRPRAVTLIAEAGLGKSRLLHEFQHHLAAHRASFWLLLGRSMPSGELQPYGLLRDLLLRRLEIADSDSAAQAREKLMQGMAPWLAEANDPAPELLGQLIGLDFSASPRVVELGGDSALLRRRALDALRLYLQRLAAGDGSTIVMLLDDLQWSDDASLDALTALLTASTASMFVLMCARPSLLERRPHWCEDHPQGGLLAEHSRITLAALPPELRGELTRSLLGRMAQVPPELAELIEQRAEGNPFYAEELVKMLLDQGVIERQDGQWFLHTERLRPQRLPTTLVGVLQARLDALDETQRHALQMASVVGPVFWDAAVGALDPRAPQALPALQHKAMVQPRADSRFEDTTEETFHHHLLHQVTYETVLKSERHAAHALAAAWLADRTGERSDEFLAIIAGHHERAGQAAPAVDWYERAAIMARQRHAIKIALQYQDRADAQAAKLPEALPPERVVRALEHRMQCCDQLGWREQQSQALDRLLDLAEQHGNLRWRASAMSGKALLADRLGHRAEAEALSRRGAEAAEQADSAAEAALCHGNLAWIHLERRELAAARVRLAQAMHWALLERERMSSPSSGLHEVQLLLIESNLHMYAGDEQARGTALHRALARSGEMHEPRLRCLCIEYVASLELDHMQLAEADRRADEVVRLSAQFDIPMSSAAGALLHSRRHLLSGNWPVAKQTALDAASVYRRIGAAVHLGKALAYYAEACWRVGEVPQAAAAWQDLCQHWQGLNGGAPLWAARIRCAQAQAASGLADDCSKAAEVVRALLPEVQADDALALAPFNLAARHAVWSVLDRAGDPLAQQQLELAVRLLQRYAARFSDPSVRARVLEEVPWHRDIMDAAHLAQGG